MAVQLSWSMTRTQVCALLGSVARCRMIAELTRYDWVPSTQLAAVARLSRTAGSQQLAILRKAKVVEVGFGRLYRLNPLLRPAPGVEFVDFGFLRLPLTAWLKPPALPAPPPETPA
jgi:hypothetical protein